MTDIETLLLPIWDGSPAGDDLRLVDGDLTFVRIDELRREIQPELDPGEGAGKEADWAGVLRECEEALTTKTKDLLLAAYLTEAMTHEQGFRGLREGLRLVREMVTRFWDGLHPGLDEGEIVLELRRRPLEWLGDSAEFIRSLRRSPLVWVDHTATLSWEQKLEAERTDATRLESPAKYEEMVQDGRMTLEQWQARISSAPVSNLEGALVAVRESQAELEGLEELCTKHLSGDDAPSLTGLRDLLEEIGTYFEGYVGTREVASPAGEAQALAGVGSVPGSAAGGGPIGSRGEALRRLSEVAEFFRRAEPHSPVSYLVQRAVRWGEMSLEELMRDVVKSSDVLEQIWDTLGIKSSEETE